jgi:hypothetical protein|tara:strand:- start:841 stop:1089 length:249 start_codon:yes stop_codon:yes gene_type:complete
MRNTNSLILLFTLIFSPRILSACATCFGAVDAPATQGLNMAILVLLAFIGVILSLIVLTIFSFYKKSKAYHLSLLTKIDNGE